MDAKSTAVKQQLYAIAGPIINAMRCPHADSLEYGNIAHPFADDVRRIGGKINHTGGFQPTKTTVDDQIDTFFEQTLDILGSVNG